MLLSLPMEKLACKANILIDPTDLADFGPPAMSSDATSPISSNRCKLVKVRRMNPELPSLQKFGFKDSRPTRHSYCYALGMVVSRFSVDASCFTRIQSWSLSDTWLRVSILGDSEEWRKCNPVFGERLKALDATLSLDSNPPTSNGLAHTKSLTPAPRKVPTGAKYRMPVLAIAEAPAARKVI